MTPVLYCTANDFRIRFSQRSGHELFLPFLKRGALVGLNRRQGYINALGVVLPYHGSCSSHPTPTCLVQKGLFRLTKTFIQAQVHPKMSYDPDHLRPPYEKQPSSPGSPLDPAPDLLPAPLFSGPILRRDPRQVGFERRRNPEVQLHPSLMEHLRGPKAYSNTGGDANEVEDAVFCSGTSRTQEFDAMSSSSGLSSEADDALKDDQRPYPSPFTQSDEDAWRFRMQFVMHETPPKAAAYNLDGPADSTTDDDLTPPAQAQAEALDRFRSAFDQILEDDDISRIRSYDIWEKRRSTMTAGIAEDLVELVVRVRLALPKQAKEAAMKEEHDEGNGKETSRLRKVLPERGGGAVADMDDHRLDSPAETGKDRAGQRDGTPKEYDWRCLCANQRK